MPVSKFKGKPKKRLHIHMLASHYDELAYLASLEGRTVSDVVRQIIAAFLRDEPEVERIRHQRGR
jgi:predicted DNA-binding protein